MDELVKESTTLDQVNTASLGNAEQCRFVGDCTLSIVNNVLRAEVSFSDNSHFIFSGITLLPVADQKPQPGRVGFTTKPKNNEKSILNLYPLIDDKQIHGDWFVNTRIGQYSGACSSTWPPHAISVLSGIWKEQSASLSENELSYAITLYNAAGQGTAGTLSYKFVDTQQGKQKNAIDVLTQSVQNGETTVSTFSLEGSLSVPEFGINTDLSGISFVSLLGPTLTNILSSNSYSLQFNLTNSQGTTNGGTITDAKTNEIWSFLGQSF